MRSLRLIRAAALSFIAICFLFTGCSGQKTASVSKPEDPGIYAGLPVFTPDPEFTYSISLAKFSNDGNYIENVVRSYNLTHPDKAVRIVEAGSDRYGRVTDAEKIRIMADENDGKGPDILILSRDQLMEFKEKGKLADLNEIAPALKVEAIPGVIELGTIDNTFVGFAPYIDVIYTCTVSKDYFSDGIWNLTDVLDIMDAHPELLRTFVARKTKMYNNIESRWDSLFKAYGLYLKDSGFIDYENRKADFYRDDFVRLLDRMREDSKNPYDYGAGKGLYLALYDELNDPMDILRMLMKDNTVFAGLPSANSTGNRFDAYLYIAVNKDCKDPEVANDFLIQALNTITTYRIPSRFYDIGSSLQYAPDYMKSEAGKLCYVTSGLYGDVYDPLGEYDGDIIELASKYEDFLRKLRPYESDMEVQGILTFEIKDFVENNGESDVVAQRIQKRIQDYLDRLE